MRGETSFSPASCRAGAEPRLPSFPARVPPAPPLFALGLRQPFRDPEGSLLPRPREPHLVAEPQGAPTESRCSAPQPAGRLRSAPPRHTPAREPDDAAREAPSRQACGFSEAPERGV